MNKRALVFGLLYCLAVIIFKLVIVLGGYTLTKFGFYYSNIVSVFLILPFFFMAIHQVREKDYQGVIGGKESVRIALTVLAVGVIGVSIYNYIEFDWKYKDIATEYYNGEEYLRMLKAEQVKHPDKIKPEHFPDIIRDQIGQLSAFRATTFKLVPLLFIGLGGAFIVSILMKRSPRL
jgi:hypothetical protein